MTRTVAHPWLRAPAWLSRLDQVPGPSPRSRLSWAFDVLVTVVAAASVLPYLLHDDRDPPAVGAVVIAVILVVTPLVLRRSYPIPVLAWLLAAAAVANQWNHHFVPGLALLVSVFTIASRLGRRAALVSAGALELAGVAVAIQRSGRGFWYDSIFLSGLVFAALALGLYVQTRRAFLAELHDRAARLERERDQQGVLAATAERARISRELHDVVAHHLTVMVALSDGAAAASAASAQRGVEVMQMVSETGRRALTDTRRLLGVLRNDDTTGTDDQDASTMAPMPDLADMDALIEQVRAAGLSVSYEVRGQRAEVSAGVQLAAYRVVQEALTNTLKHAGDGVHARVRVVYDNDGLQVDVLDDGAGASAPVSVGVGSGLTGMRERVNAYGGELTAGPLRPVGVAGLGATSPGRRCTGVISVLLVDDQALLRMGFRLILEAEPDIAVVGEAEDGHSGIAMAATLKPDVILMDVRMPRVNGIEATAQIVAARSASRVLILTTFDLDQYVFDGLRAGASGFLLKDCPPQTLLAAIRTIAGGDAVLAPTATRRLIDQFASQLPRSGTVSRSGALLDQLTDRERSVFAQLAGGRSNREIAADLHLSEGTVKVHVSRVLAKLELRDRVQAVVLAYESGLITPGG